VGNVEYICIENFLEISSKDKSIYDRNRQKQITVTPTDELQ